MTRTMLRFLMLVLIMLLPLPALAKSGCPGAPSVKAETPHRGHAPQPKPDDRATPGHPCVGCVPPRACLDGALADPIMPLALSHRILADHRPDGRAIRPALPPPRLAA